MQQGNYRDRVQQLRLQKELQWSSPFYKKIVQDGRKATLLSKMLYIYSA